ncbi:MAG: response regulator [Actinophytocola sp.]|uniref:response regulator n=1 Tax=Actinophytocola sp. TaxID=1872138 RepID=UPI001320ECA2|nr:response regulator transcription factor [Actinophytocola sp.]MPZ79002.1 response regulator [Actinophytocola sp.]
MPIRVFVVDDHEIVRRGVADLIAHEPDLEFVGEASSADEALARVPHGDVDVVVLDVRMSGGDGVTLCRQLRSRLPEVRCLVLTFYPDEEALLAAITAGASGFVLKSARGSELLDAVRTVARGRSLIDRRTAVALLQRLDQERETKEPLAVLTEHERDVFGLIGEGLTNREIGDRLCLTEKTVKNYVSHLLAKLGMRRRTQVAVLSARLHAQDERRAELSHRLDASDMPHAGSV